MALFEWSNRFTTGIESIDSQHKKLVDYVNQLHEGMLAGKSLESMGPILDGLVDYTVKHFKYEEELFTKTGYVEALIHKKEHAALVKQVGEFQTKFKAGTVSLSTDLMNFLKTWLTNHILGSDKRYTPHLVSKGIK